jgi:hypothetical protein
MNLFIVKYTEPFKKGQNRNSDKTPMISFNFVTKNKSCGFIIDDKKILCYLYRRILDVY